MDKPGIKRNPSGDQKKTSRKKEETQPNTEDQSIKNQLLTTDPYVKISQFPLSEAYQNEVIAHFKTLSGHKTVFELNLALPDPVLVMILSALTSAKFERVKLYNHKDTPANSRLETKVANAIKTFLKEQTNLKTISFIFDVSHSPESMAAILPELQPLKALKDIVFTQGTKLTDSMSRELVKTVEENMHLNCEPLIDKLTPEASTYVKLINKRRHLNGKELLINDFPSEKAYYFASALKQVSQIHSLEKLSLMSLTAPQSESIIHAFQNHYAIDCVYYQNTRVLTCDLKQDAKKLTLSVHDRAGFEGICRSFVKNHTVVASCCLPETFMSKHTKIIVLILNEIQNLSIKTLFAPGWLACLEASVNLSKLINQLPALTTLQINGTNLKPTYYHEAKAALEKNTTRNITLSGNETAWTLVARR